MSMKSESSLTFAAIHRRAWSRMFGSSIREIREAGGQSIEAAACLAGMEISEWAAVEAGHVPQDVNRLRAMAGALEMRWDQMAMLAFVCQGAWS
jgi:transcriptional regulator with XRE-family HTH domain